jgi:hypothetical protein
MQSLSPFLADLLKTLAGTVIGLIPFAVQTYRNRKKSAIEDAEALARTDLTKVNTRSAELRDLIAAGDQVNKFLTALIQSGDTIHDLQMKVFQLEQERIGNAMMRLDLKKATALLAFNHIRFSEAEHPEVKKLVEELKRLVP